MWLRELYYKVKRKLREPSLVLMYHRIATPDTDAWQLCVSPENFAEQLQVLRNNYKVVPLADLYQQTFNWPFQRKSVAITFDDGYIDNFLEARVLLKKFSLPATFFITSRNIGRTKEFWSDELEDILLQSPVLPSSFKIKIEEHGIGFELGSETVLTEEMKLRHSTYEAFKPISLRTELYLKLWQLLGPLPAQKQEQLMEKIREWAAVKESPRPGYCCMSEEQLKMLASDKLFVLGGHTATHPLLSCHSKETQLQEIQSNKEFLEKLTGNRVRFFAYPSGNYNETTIQSVKESHLDAAVTTNHELVSRKSSPFEVGRIQVMNWNGEEFRSVLSAWLSN